MRRAQIGVVGCGNISGIYFKNAKLFRSTEIVACADLDMERARAKAAEYGVPRACTVDQLLADPDIEIVLNLTIPRAHAEVCLATVEAGKHTYVEKPLAVSREDGRRLLDAAASRWARVGGAPDTFLGGGLQTCRKLIDDGAIGEPIGAAAFMLCHGHESWHPDPAFYYQAGGGPMFDMGPYYLTALISLMGPAVRATAAARITFPERTITSAPKRGETIQVEVPTHVAGVLEFATGAIGTILTTFDAWHSTLPRIELYGSEGTMLVPDPNDFAGPVLVAKPGSSDWREVPLTHGFAENSRGVGLADMAAAIQSGRQHRASGEMAYHVLDIMEAFHDAAREGRHIELTSGCERPAPLPIGLPPDTVDD
jgi:predicted dehydrogenase